MRARAYEFLFPRKYEDKTWYWTIHIKIGNQESWIDCTTGNALLNRVYSPYPNILELTNYYSLRANIGCQNINNQYSHRRRRSQNEIRKAKILISRPCTCYTTHGRFLALVLPVKAVEGIKRSI